MDALKQRITIDEDILGGKPVIRGMRISVEQILRAMAAGVPQDDLLADYPELEPDDILAVFVYAIGMRNPSAVRSKRSTARTFSP